MKGEERLPLLPTATVDAGRRRGRRRRGARHVMVPGRGSSALLLLLPITVCARGGRDGWREGELTSEEQVLLR